MSSALRQRLDRLAGQLRYTELIRTWDATIADLPLSLPTKMALKSHDLTFDKLMSTTRRQLLRKSGIGHKKVDDIVDALESKGFCLADGNDPTKMDGLFKSINRLKKELEHITAIAETLRR